MKLKIKVCDKIKITIAIKTSNIVKNVKIILFPDGEDPDSFAHKLEQEEFQKFLNENSWKIRKGLSGRREKFLE